MPAAASCCSARWHRGMREMDLILGRFADAEIGALTGDEIDQYERLLDIPDTEFLPLVTGERPVPADTDCAVLQKILASPLHDILNTSNSRKSAKPFSSGIATKQDRDFMSLIPTIGLPKGRAGQFIVDGVADGYEAFALVQAAHEIAPDKPVLFVARDGQRLPAIVEALAFAAPGLPVLELPAWDCLPYDRVSPGSDAAASGSTR